MHGGKLMGLYQFNPVAISRCQFLMILDALVEVGKVLLVNGKDLSDLNNRIQDHQGVAAGYSNWIELVKSHELVEVGKVFLCNGQYLSHVGKRMEVHQYLAAANSSWIVLVKFHELVEVGKVLLVNGKVAKGLNRTAGGRGGACIRYSRRVDLIALLGNRPLGSGFLGDFRLQSIVPVLARLRVPERLRASRKHLHHL